jgi:hypothetical protein
VPCPKRAPRQWEPQRPSGSGGHTATRRTLLKVTDQAPDGPHGALPKLRTRVRFSSPAHNKGPGHSGSQLSCPVTIGWLCPSVPQVRRRSATSASTTFCSGDCALANLCRPGGSGRLRGAHAALRVPIGLVRPRVSQAMAGTSRRARAATVSSRRVPTATTGWCEGGAGGPHDVSSR